MRQLPTGKVTFLFTDIEGSTQLLQELGSGYVDALAEHRRLLRETVTRNCGVEVDTQGDAFFFAFERADYALAAAAEGQCALEAGPVRVRIGIHTGEPIVTDDGYVGIDVHRAARICSAAHGGQTVLSQDTRAYLDTNVQLRDLGLHRLKDLAEPVRLFQLGAAKFPPLRSLNATNLPVQATPLVGRGRELAEVLELFSYSRLVTLTGTGGSGKTRLALQAAAELVEDFRDGVFWVPLAALGDSGYVEPTIAAVLGAKDGLARFLDEKRLLLLLDNLEQILDCAPDLAELLRSCPNLRLLVTSRAPLRVAGEQEYEVPPLPEADAVVLFVQRARQVKRGFEPDEDVAEICRRLDGLPLAVELAAARVRVLSPQQILERLGQSLDVLTFGPRDAPERQRTLRATIEWSYDLLDPDEQTLFGCLSVFAGGCSLASVEDVCMADPDTLHSLVEKSLLHHDGDHFLMLETIREYAVAHLAARPDADEIRSRHQRHFLALAETADMELRGPGQPHWLDRLEQEHDNIRAALKWGLAESDFESSLRLAAALELFWDYRGHYAEGRRWLEEALRGSANTVAATRARAANVAAFLAWRQADLESARALAETAVALGREAGDAHGLARSLNTLGNVLQIAGEVELAATVYEECEEQARRVGDLHALSTTTHNRGCVALLGSNYSEAEALLTQSLALARRVGAPDVIVNALIDLAYLALHEGRHADAAALFHETLETNERLGWKELAVYCLLGLAAVAVAEGDLVRAATLGGAAEASREAIGLHSWLEQYVEEIAGQIEAALQPRITEAAIADAHSAGRALNLDESTAYAANRPAARSSAEGLSALQTH
jgi:predicted ATPase/class 3 adenylate cyclase